MYFYDEFDQQLVNERVDQFRDQVNRRLKGKLSEDEFKPFRLLNGLYLQLHAYMFRICIPYGILSSKQLHKLADIAKKYDKNYGHFTTRQNIQFNWIKLEEAPDILADLATVQMHGIQTSGNSFRNTTTDQYAGVTPDEIEDPRPYCEIVRQWATLHPEFTFLPRKYKIAITGSKKDRAAIKVHDIGLAIQKNEKDEIGFKVLVGGGQGRIPYIGQVIRDFLPKEHLLSYIEAITRVYNQLGRRDNIHKARIKILLAEVGLEKFSTLVEKEWNHIKNNEKLKLTDDEIKKFKSFFLDPKYKESKDLETRFTQKLEEDPGFSEWYHLNTRSHKKDDHRIVILSLKPKGQPPGDLNAEQMRTVADMTKKYSHDEIRVTHEQNLVFPYTKKADLYQIWEELRKLNLATTNIGLASDIICCPGMDFCALATARSIPVAQQLSNYFHDLKSEKNIGNLRIKISGCINACGHHHVGNIGILGIDRGGEEYYQVTLGGSADENASIGERTGPAFSKREIYNAIDKIIGIYLEKKTQGENFLQTYRRIGMEPFKEKLYETH